MIPGDIVTFPGSPHRWTLVEPATSPNSNPWWKLARKGTEAHMSPAEYTSRTQAEGGLTYISSPTFANGEAISTLTNRGQVITDTGGDTVSCLMRGGEKELCLGDSIWDGEGLSGIPDGPVKVAIDPGVELVPRWILVLRNRL